jgi:dihydrolipoamide dehydrogenase
MAGVGLTEGEAHQAGYRVKVGLFPFRANGKALILNQTEGTSKVVADADTGTVLGLHLLGPGAIDLLGEGLMATTIRCSLDDIVNAIHHHPALGEVVREAALDAKDRAIHI